MKVKVAEKVKALASAAPQFPTQAPGQTRRCFTGTVPRERDCIRVSCTFFGRRGNGPDSSKFHTPFSSPRHASSQEQRFHLVTTHFRPLLWLYQEMSQLTTPTPESVFANGKPTRSLRPQRNRTRVKSPTQKPARSAHGPAATGSTLSPSRHSPRALLTHAGCSVLAGSDLWAGVPSFPTQEAICEK